MPVERAAGGTSLIDVLDRVLDKGIVIDAWVRVSLVGIDLITVEARVVVASIDTYLKYSEAVARRRARRTAVDLPRQAPLGAVARHGGGEGLQIKRGHPAVHLPRRVGPSASHRADAAPPCVLRGLERGRPPAPARDTIRRDAVPRDSARHLGLR